MTQPHDDREQMDTPQSEADVTSQTRFGPRPVPKDHRRLSEAPQSRHIPPHGDVSPDGKRIWPQPSRAARWLVWGGTALAVAGMTAGAVIAARKASDLLSDDKPRRPVQPRMTPPGPPPSAQAPWQDDRPRPPRPRRKRRLMDEVQENTAHLGNSVDGVMRSLTSALSGFRTVAGQAGSIMREFSDAADLVRGVMGDDKPKRHRKSRRPNHPAPKDPTAYADRHGAHMPDLRDDPVADDTTNERDYRRPTDSRMHRL